MKRSVIEQIFTDMVVGRSGPIEYRRRLDVYWAGVRKALSDELTVDIEVLEKRLRLHWTALAMRRYGHILPERRRYVEALEALSLIKRMVGPTTSDVILLLWPPSSGRGRRVIPAEAIDDWLAMTQKLQHGIAGSLARIPKRPAHRVADEALEGFAYQIAFALHDAGEMVAVSRKGRYAAVLRIMMAAAGLRVPRDVFPIVRKAVAEMDAVIAELNRRAGGQPRLKSTPGQRGGGS